MTIETMFGQSALLTVIGMATVFAFLALIIFCVNVSAKIIHHLGLDKEASGKESKTAADGGHDSGVIAAIFAALIRYREERSGR